MDSQTTSLFIGRFQPFHKGHIDAVQQIFESGNTKFLLLGIGSAEENYTAENPFTASERFEMIFKSLIEAGFSKESFNICPVRNIHHYALWSHHVVQLLPRFSRIFSGSPLVCRLFREQLPHIETVFLKDRTGISATKVRQQLLENEYPENTLPSAGISFLKKIDAQKRLKDIYQTGF